MDTQSTGSSYTKKSVQDVFVVTKYTDITKGDKEENSEDDTPKDNNIQQKEVKEETPKEEKVVEKPKVIKKEEVTEQLTMSDFFEEFKI